MTAHRWHPSTDPRLVVVGPTTWRQADASRWLCCFCSESLAEGDRIACQAHSTVLAMTPFVRQEG